ncbi:hypothetical protein ACTG9Q_31580 [Actinokineospora sp. 24-640]
MDRNVSTPLAHISPAHSENINFSGAIKDSIQATLAVLIPEARNEVTH